MTSGGMLALQRMVGNRAVTSAIERTNLRRPYLQRVAVSYGGTGETLYNQEESGTGKAEGHHYGGSGTFQLTRDGDAGVNLEVRIRFLKQTRNTMPKRRPSDPEVGELIREQTVLPAGDQAWATQTAADAVAKWNGKLVLVGKDKPAPDAEEKTKRLKVTFKSTPVFNKTDPADTEVIVHPPGVIGGSTGQPHRCRQLLHEEGRLGLPGQRHDDLRPRVRPPDGHQRRVQPEQRSDESAHPSMALPLGTALAELVLQRYLEALAVMPA